jgi:biopolymer transport protein TolR
MAFGQLEDGQRPGKPISEINVTPLVDVMLVLVVIFILTAPILASSIRLDLPKANGDTVKTEQASAPHLSLTVDRAGQAFLGDQPLSLADLSQRFKQVAAFEPSTELHLRADQAAPYGRVVEVLDVAQNAGLNRIGFVTEPARADKSADTRTDASRTPQTAPAPAPR